VSLGRPEKLVSHDAGGAYRRFEKKRVNKARRQAERRDPENAPTKNRYLGWAT
jgi:hypothetical protein